MNLMILLRSASILIDALAARVSTYELDWKPATVVANYCLKRFSIACNSSPSFCFSVAKGSVCIWVTSVVFPDRSTVGNAFVDRP